MIAIGAKGTKGKYTEWLTDDGLLRIKGWARDGLTNEQISHNIGITYTTLKEWMNRFPAVSAAIKEGKAPVDIEVENALLKAALGYTVKVRKAVKLRKKGQIPGKGVIEEERIEYVDEEVYYPPNVTAQIYWLNNRRPDRWRNRREIVETAANSTGDTFQALDAAFSEAAKDVSKK